MVMHRSWAWYAFAAFLLHLNSSCGNAVDVLNLRSAKKSEAALYFTSKAATTLPVPPGISPSDPLVLNGYLDARLFNSAAHPVDPTGKVDSTAGLKLALKAAYEYGFALYLRKGTYLVTDTLEQLQGGSASCTELFASGTGPGKWGTPFGQKKTVVMVGEKSNIRPTIKLKDNLPAFGKDAAKPKPVIYFHNQEKGDQCAFRLNFRGIDINLGRNPKAFGISMPSAQNSTISDIAIDASNAYAGIIGIPGRGNSATNIEVIGGELGIVSDELRGVAMQGIHLHGQTTASLKVTAGESIAIAGFRFEPGPGASAVQITGSDVGLFLDDGLMGMSIPATAPLIDNASSGTMYLSNVVVRTDDIMVQVGLNGAPVKGSGSWQKISSYSYAPAGEIAIANGVKLASSVRLIMEAGLASPLGGFLNRHPWKALPSFEDDDAANVMQLGATGNGVSDDTLAIQTAINQNAKVFFPRGDYIITKPLVLKKDTQLFGVPGSFSRIIPMWTPTAPTYAIRTVVDEDDTASAFLGDLRIQNPADTLDRTYIGAILWRLGGTSYTNQISIGADWRTTSNKRFGLLITGPNSGGRWFGFVADSNGTSNPDVRNILVSNAQGKTTFYGVNIEHVQSETNVEIVNSKNVRIIGTKTESFIRVQGEVLAFNPWLIVRNSQNILLGGFTSHSEADADGNTGPNKVIQVIESDDVLLANIRTPRQQLDTAMGPLIVETFAGKTTIVPGTKNCRVLIRGKFAPEIFE